MRDLVFRAEGMRLSRVEGFGGIVAGSSGYLRAVFELSPDYEGCDVIASFYDAAGRNYAAPLVGGSCAVPSEVTGGRRWKVALVAVADGLRINTNSVIVRQEARPDGNA